MKTSILLLTIALFPMVNYASGVVITDSATGVLVKEICVNELSYIVAISGYGNSLQQRPIALTQVYERDADRRNPPQPKVCK